MSDPEQPATCQPLDPSVSGWWYLQDGEFIVTEYWNAEGGTWDEFFVDRPISCAEWAHASGYRILGPVPTFAEVEEARDQINRARARIAKLEAYVRDVSTQKTMDEMTHQEGLRADWEGGWDTLIERAREALTP